jgi:hypothetical protein
MTHLVSTTLGCLSWSVQPAGLGLPTDKEKVGQLNDVASLGHSKRKWAECGKGLTATSTDLRITRLHSCAPR